MRGKYPFQTLFGSLAKSSANDSDCFIIHSESIIVEKTEKKSESNLEK